VSLHAGVEILSRTYIKRAIGAAQDVNKMHHSTRPKSEFPWW
jgi:hypothetical protein